MNVDFFLFFFCFFGGGRGEGLGWGGVEVALAGGSSGGCWLCGLERGWIGVLQGGKYVMCDWVALGGWCVGNGWRWRLLCRLPTGESLHLPWKIHVELSIYFVADACL